MDPETQASDVVFNVKEFQYFHNESLRREIKKGLTEQSFQNVREEKE